MQTRKRTLTADYGSVEFGAMFPNARPGETDEMNEKVTRILQQMMTQFLDFVDVLLQVHVPVEGEQDRGKNFRGRGAEVSRVWIDVTLNGASIGAFGPIMDEIAHLMQVVVIDPSQSNLELAVQHTLTSTKP
jgi:hypothetical protein